MKSITRHIVTNIHGSGSKTLEIRSQIIVLNLEQLKQDESLKQTVPPQAGVFIWYLNNAYTILNNLKIENIQIYKYISTLFTN